MARNLKNVFIFDIIIFFFSETTCCSKGRQDLFYTHSFRQNGQKANN